MAAGARTHLTLLGAWRLHRRGDEIALPLGAQRLLALLALTGARSRAWVAGTLWPEVDDSRAQANLRTALWRLRDACPETVQAEGSRLALGDDVSCDVGDLVDWLSEVQRAGVAPHSRASMWDVRLLSGGELLPGWYDEWVVIERERLRQLQLHALERLAERLLESGQVDEAIAAVFRAISAEPLRESPHRLLIRAHLAEGNAAEAIRHFEWFQRLLRTELGVPPSRLMLDLVQPLAAAGAKPPRTA